MPDPDRSTSVQTRIADRRRKVSEMYLRGMYMADIARELGVDRSQISRDLKELRKQWLEQSINHVNQKKAIELAKLDRLEVEFWDAWERSKRDAETITEETGTGPRGHIGKRTHQRVGQVGNPAYLAGVLDCIKKRCEILGIDAPVKQDHNVSLVEMSLDEWHKQRRRNNDQAHEALATFGDQLDDGQDEPQSGEDADG